MFVQVYIYVLGVIVLTVLFMLSQDSFYHNLTQEEHARVHEYNFDHPGKGNAYVVKL